MKLCITENVSVTAQTITQNMKLRGIMTKRATLLTILTLAPTLTSCTSLQKFLYGIANLHVIDTLEIQIKNEFKDEHFPAHCNKQMEKDNAAQERDQQENDREKYSRDGESGISPQTSSSSEP